jgi:hypothetical protein
LVQPETPCPDIQIGFFKDGGTVTFDNLKFGFFAEVEGENVYEESYPPEGFSYICTDQTYIASERVNFNYDDFVFLTFWAENAGERYDGSIEFSIPRPDSPYPSWSWNGSEWKAPVLYPNDGGIYVWDEDSQGWATINPNSKQGDD